MGAAPSEFDAQRKLKLPSLSTHVLDAAEGGPRSGVAVEVADGSGVVVATGTTDQQGRIADLAPSLAPGSYRIRWVVAGSFLADVSAAVVLDGDRHYHVPLLASGVAAVVYLGA
jgi:5-hydroxyisourate hydrolase